MRARPLARSLATPLLAVAAVLVLTSAQGGTRTRAQTAPSVDARTPAEAEALETLENGLMISARTQAEAILRGDPSSIVGHYVLGRAYFDAEGSLARAMFHLGKARELYENQSVGAPGSAFHQELLYQTSRLAGQMELFEFQLELLGYHDHLYDPDMIAERCWPLMKLGRMDEARQFALTAVGSPNPWQRSAGLNAMCAVEGEARTREPYFQSCTAALEDARREVARATAAGNEDESGGISVDAYNAALGAAAALRFTDAESLAEEGVRRFEPSPANPWRLLVELHLAAGRVDPALEAFAQMVRWNDRQPAALRDQSRADIESTVALMLLFAGESEQSMLRIDRALDRPDRRGLTTDGAEQARGRHALMRRMVRRALVEEDAERASYMGFGARTWNALGGMDDGLTEWPDQERVIAVLTDERRLTDTLRPYVPGSIAGLSPWMVGELVDVLGPAIVAVGLDEAKELDAEVPGAAGYYLALEAEIAAARGDEDRALILAERALPLLEDAGFALVRARLAAVAAQAAEDAGRHRRANELYTIALQVDPGVLRRLRLALPTRIRGSGGAASEAADLLEASPRFRDADGFVVEVTSLGTDGLRACLRSATGNELQCAEARLPPPEPEPEPPAEGEAEQAPDEDAEEEEDPLTLPQLLAQEVHRQLFSARIELSRIDMRSLDGRVTGGSTVANDRLREVMGQSPPP